jgi:hypothetical protein
MDHGSGRTRGGVDAQHPDPVPGHPASRYWHGDRAHPAQAEVSGGSGLLAYCAPLDVGCVGGGFGGSGYTFIARARAFLSGKNSAPMCATARWLTGASEFAIAVTLATGVFLACVRDIHGAALLAGLALDVRRLTGGVARDASRDRTAIPGRVSRGARR